jgi:hypothetical protein
MKLSAQDMENLYRLTEILLTSGRYTVDEAARLAIQVLVPNHLL